MGHRLGHVPLLGGLHRGVDPHRLREARLHSADLRAADLRDAELSQCDVSAACFDVVDENYLRELRESGRLEHWIYRLWWLTSDCGRSLRRWAAVIFVVALVFAGLYRLAGVDVGAHDPGILTYVYYSVVTLTSLGYGDIVPTSGPGQLLVIVEVCAGYMMLGGLISILASKMARRGD